ncbi:MAG: FHA domain-containing protein [Chloroflexi bacterium]|nr:FHA domain-containing protein [Chloroflexota bacterium]
MSEISSKTNPSAEPGQEGKSNAGSPLEAGKKGNIFETQRVDLAELKALRDAAAAANSTENAAADAPSTVEIGPPDEIEHKLRMGNLISSQIARLKLWIGDAPEKSLPLEITRYVILGHTPESAGLPLDVDLTPFGAPAQGVSRRHLMITYDHSLLQVKDLKSTNGTLLNGMPLVPFAARVLRDGDVLHLGRLLLRVEFLRSLADDD